jgi:hypothetical protein
MISRMTSVGTSARYFGEAVEQLGVTGEPCLALQQLQLAVVRLEGVHDLVRLAVLAGHLRSIDLPPK